MNENECRLKYIRTKEKSVEVDELQENFLAVVNE